MEMQTITYGIISVFLVSFVSLVGVALLAIKAKKLKKILLYLVSLSVGALLGDVFIHLLPEAFKEYDATLVGMYALCGILFSFVIEKIIHYRHRHVHKHDRPHEKHPHAFAVMNLVGDAFHNFIDGILIAASYIVSIPVGVATTIAIILHEVPQEIGDFGVLLHGGFTKSRAIMLNLLTAFTAVLGTIIGFLIASSESMLVFLLPFSAGNFIYIASANLIPELHRSAHEEKSLGITVVQLFAMAAGMVAMLALLLLE